MIIKRVFHPVKPGGQLVGPAKEPCGTKNNFSLGEEVKSISQSTKPPL